MKWTFCAALLPHAEVAALQHQKGFQIEIVAVDNMKFVRFVMVCSGTVPENTVSVGIVITVPAVQRSEQFHSGLPVEIFFQRRHKVCKLKKSACSNRGGGSVFIERFHRSAEVCGNPSIFRDIGNKVVGDPLCCVEILRLSGMNIAQRKTIDAPRLAAGSRGTFAVALTAQGAEKYSCFRIEGDDVVYGTVRSCRVRRPSRSRHG